MTYEFECGDVVKAGTEFAGTVVETDDGVTVENRDGERETFAPGDLKETV